MLNDPETVGGTVVPSVVRPTLTGLPAKNASREPETDAIEQNPVKNDARLRAPPWAATMGDSTLRYRPSLVTRELRMFQVATACCRLRRYAGQDTDRTCSGAASLALLGRPAIPCRRRRQIARDAFSGATHDAELELRAGMPRIGGPAKPGCRRGRIARPPRAPQRVVSNDQLRGDDARFSRRAIAA